jgi:hypothetical protein
MTDAAVTQSPAQAAPRRYGFSVLLSGCAPMGRALVPGLAAVVGNAVVQALLTWWNPAVGRNWAYVLALLVALASIVVLLAILSAAALQSVTGRASLPSVLAQVRHRAGPFLAWLAVLAVAMVAAQLLLPGLGAVVVMIGVFIPLAAMDGRGNALAANFAAQRERFGRWLVTSVIVLLGAVTWFVLAALNTFFVKGMLASLLSWLVVGVLLWWLATAWACLYRSTRVGARPLG